LNENQTCRLKVQWGILTHFSVRRFYSDEEQRGSALSLDNILAGGSL